MFSQLLLAGGCARNSNFGQKFFKFPNNRKDFRRGKKKDKKGGKIFLKREIGRGKK